MRRLLCASLLTCLVVLTSASTWTKPAFCGDKECPEYTLLSQTDSYEMRQYKPSVWVEVMKVGTEDRKEMFNKLFQYIRGKNSRGERMAMKVPVVAHLSTDGDHAEAVRMYLGEDTDDFDPPRPTDAEVHIHTDPQMTFYVRSFRDRNWRNINTWKREASTLRSAIPANLRSLTEFCGASYGPKRTDSMYMEVWIPASANHADHHHHHHDHDTDHDHHHGDHDHDH